MRYKAYMLSDTDKKNISTNMQKYMSALRNTLGMSQAELAESIGVSRPTIAAYETYARDISWSTTLLLIFFFCLNPTTYLMMRTFRILTPSLDTYFKELKGNGRINSYVTK